MTRIYTLVNQKGGVGKTTTAINLGAYLAQMGQQVLVVDLDPQANATSCLGVDKYTVQGSTYDALLYTDIPASSILYNERLSFHLLPSPPSLAGAEIELVEEDGREFRLKNALGSLDGKYDYILIDCPPRWAFSRSMDSSPPGMACLSLYNVSISLWKASDSSPRRSSVSSPRSSRTCACAA